MQINWYIDFGSGMTKVPPPKNWKELELELLFVNDRADMPYQEFPSASVQAVNFEWVGSNAKNLNTYITGGLTGVTPGIYESVPIRIDFCYVGGKVVSLEQYGIDLANEGCLFECDKVVAPLIKVGQIDFVNQIADTVSFPNLASNLYAGPAAGAITFNDYTRTPYCIAHLPNWTLLVTFQIAIYLLFKELREGIIQIAHAIANLIAFIASCTLSWGNVLIVAAHILYILLLIIYYGLILLALINLVQECIDQIWQKVKYKLGMRVYTLMEKACASIGLKFASTLLGSANGLNGLTIIPRKIVIPDPANPLYAFNRPANEEKDNGKVFGYYQGTFKQLIVDMQDLLNAAGKVVGDTFYFEQVNFWDKKNPFKLPNTVVPGYHVNAPDPHGTNASRLAMNYFIEYALDTQDQNTYDNYSGTTVQVSLNPKKVKNTINQLNKGLTRKSLAFAQTTRKEHMSFIENTINDTINALGSFASFIIAGIQSLGGSGSGSPPGLVTNSRIGWMEMSSDYIGVPKIFIGTGYQNNWMVSSTSRSKLAAINLLQSYHGVNLATRNNQYLLYKDKKIPLCCENFVSLTTNNVLVDAHGYYGKFSKILWNPFKETAIVDYGLQLNFTNNLTETITQDGK